MGSSPVLVDMTDITVGELSLDVSARPILTWIWGCVLISVCRI